MIRDVKGTETVQRLTISLGELPCRTCGANAKACRKQSRCCVCVPAALRVSKQPSRVTAVSGQALWALEAGRDARSGTSCASYRRQDFRDRAQRPPAGCISVTRFGDRKPLTLLRPGSRETAESGGCTCPQACAQPTCWLATADTAGVLCPQTAQAARTTLAQSSRVERLVTRIPFGIQSRSLVL